MSFSSANEIITAVRVEVTEEELTVGLADGRTVSAPLSWYPRLVHATPEERSQWQLVGGGFGIHWPGVDEDLSVASLLAGRPSGERQESLQRWLVRRQVLVLG